MTQIAQPLSQITVHVGVEPRDHGALVSANFVERQRTTHFIVNYDSALGANGPRLADAVLGSCEADFDQLQGWFGNIGIGGLPFTVYIQPGSNGASHASCSATGLYCDAFSGADADLVKSLVVAEEDEVFMANQNKGWNCAASNGEALSRVLAAEIYPNELTPPSLSITFSTANNWLNGGRPDFVTNTDPTDRNFVSIGCGALFINWLRYQNGFTLNQIVQAGGSTLQQTYQSLTDRLNGFNRFLWLISYHYPPGATYSLANDNPFPLSPTPDPKVKGNLAVFPMMWPSGPLTGKKTLFATSTAGMLIQLWDTDHWNIGFPDQAGLSFQGEVAVFPTDALYNKKTLFAITTDGKLVQLWDTDRWNIGFPAELAGRAELRFQGGMAVVPTDTTNNKKVILAITTDGKASAAVGHRSLECWISGRACWSCRASFSRRSGGSTYQLWQGDLRHHDRRKASAGVGYE